MADFSQFLRRPSGEAKRPPPLFPADDYQGIIKNHEIGDDNQKKTPYVRFHVGLTAWGASVPASWHYAGSKGEQIETSQSEIDLSKRQMRRDFYLTDDALWRLDEFLSSCGIQLGRPYEELLPETTGASVTVQVQQYLNERSNEVGNQIGKLTGAR